MTRDPKRLEADLAARRPPSWAGGSRTTESMDRIRALHRRRAKIASLMLARNAKVRRDHRK